MVARVCLGLLPDGTYGLKVSKPGIDVLTSDEGGLTFSSGSGFMRIIARGSFQWAFQESSRSINIGTTFGYTPIVQIYTYNDPAVIASADGSYTATTTNVNVRFEGTNAIFTNEYNVGSATIVYVIYTTRAV